jgi:hypothetical protein
MLRFCEALISINLKKPKEHGLLVLKKVVRCFFRHIAHIDRLGKWDDLRTIDKESKLWMLENMPKTDLCLVYN